MEFRAAVELGFGRGEPPRFEKGENAETRPLVEGEYINGDLTAIIFVKSKCGGSINNQREPASAADTAFRRESAEWKDPVGPEERVCLPELCCSSPHMR